MRTPPASGRFTLFLAAFLCLVAAGSRPGAQTDEAASITILAAEYRDLDGDLDGIPDTGETGRVLFEVRNDGPTLTNAFFTMASDDTDVACIIGSSVFVSLLEPGGTVALGSLDPSQPGFSFRASDSLESEPGRGPASVTLCLSVAADGVASPAPACIDLRADIDFFSGEIPPPVPGPDGISGTADDGIVDEDFDTDRDGDGRVSLSDQPAGTPGASNDTIGVTVSTGLPGTGLLQGVGCSGFHVPPEDPGCIIDPDHDMDWHVHCPAGECDNLPLHTTPADGMLSKSGRNSLHWGAHFRQNSFLGDSTHFRQIAAFMTDPINLALDAGADPLELSFFHIASMMDDHSLHLIRGEAVDFGDVQIQVDQNPDPAVDEWGFWEKLVPFQNGYDHVAYVWSTFGSAITYCLLTPTDAGPDPAARSGFRELLCHPAGVWSHCGSPYLFSFLYDCAGPAAAGSLGNGLWVETKFGLDTYAGQRIRLRWIGQSWEFDCCASSYQELGGSWNDVVGDDGWWIDDITLTGAVTAQASFGPDTSAPLDTTCPPGTCNDLDGDGYGSPADPLCRAGDLPDCAPGDVTIHPGAAEVCDGIDNNCDGLVDDTDPNLGAPCGGRERGECRKGVLVCTDGALVCEGNVEPTPEVCDGLDNDCDGNVDNGVPGTGARCGVTDVGACRTGIVLCTNNELVCTGSIDPAPEVCDGLDNDCDGVTDELVVGRSTSLSPSSLNVNSMGSTFSLSTRLVNTCTGLPGDDWRLGTVHISRVGTPSLGTIVLPEPSLDPGCDSATQDGIWEDRPSRSVSGNGSITFRFNQPSDGLCETADGNRQDLIAVLAGAVDREVATVCYAGFYAGDVRVENCATVEIRSKGNR